MAEKMNSILWHQCSVSKAERCLLKKQKPCLLWFTGLSGAGKSTVANAVDAILHDRKLHIYVLDGDNLRHGLNHDLSFSDADRIENIRRAGEVSSLMLDAGLIVLSAFISPEKPELTIDAGIHNPEECAQQVINYLQTHQFI